VADGLQGIVSRFGKECEKYGSCIKGSDPYWDARTGGRLGIRELEMVVIPHPRVPTSGQVEPDRIKVDKQKMPLRKLGKLIGMSQESMDRIFSSDDKFDVGGYLPHSEDFFSIDTCLGFCTSLQKFRNFVGVESLAELYSAVTGIKIGGHELKMAGERAWNIFKALNVREGFSRKDDKFPPKWFEPLKDGDKQIFLKDNYKTEVLTKENAEKLLDDYYEERGWDIEKGIPTREKLEELGLNDIADDLANREMLP